MREQHKYSITIFPREPNRTEYVLTQWVMSVKDACFLPVSQFFCSLLFLEFSLRSMEIMICLWSLIYLHAVFSLAEVLNKRDISNLCKDKDQESGKGLTIVEFFYVLGLYCSHFPWQDCSMLPDRQNKGMTVEMMCKREDYICRKEIGVQFYHFIYVLHFQLK